MSIIPLRNLVRESNASREVETKIIGLEMDLQLLADSDKEDNKGLKKNAVKKDKGSYFLKTKLDDYEINTKKFKMHERKEVRLLKNRYSNKCVIRKIDIDDEGIVIKDYNGVTSNSPLMDALEPDKNFYNAAMRIENKKNDIVYKKPVGYLKGEKCEYVFYPDITEVCCHNNQLQIKMTRCGFWFKENKHIEFIKPKDAEGWTYLPGCSVWGPSNEKHATKFFFSSNKTREQWWFKINELTGFAYDYFLDSVSDPKKILKNVSRLNMFGTTMELLDTIDLAKDYIVVSTCSFNAARDTDDATTKMLEEHGMDFGSNINDGKIYYHAAIIANGLKISEEEALDYALQSRVNYIQSKCLEETLSDFDMKQTCKNVKALYGDAVKVYGNTKGRCMLIVDDDGAKLVNVKALEKGNAKLRVYGLAVAKSSTSRTSGQMIAKALEKDEEYATDRMLDLVEDAVKRQYLKKMSGNFVPQLGVSHNTGAVLGEKAILKENWIYNVCHDLELFIKSAIADLKVELESIYNHAMFDDCFVRSCGLIDHILTIKHTKKRGLLIETFSRDILYYFEEEIKAIENNKNLTEEEKEDALDDLLSAEVIKYPSAGAEEYLGVRYLTIKEWNMRKKEKIAELKNLTDDIDIITSFQNYMERKPFGVTIFASFNFIKNKLAGMDVDFDAILAIFDNIKNVLLNELAESILTYIDYFDKTNANYEDLFGKEKRADLRF